MSTEFDEGYIAQTAGKGFLDNPYLVKGDATGIAAACRWIDGYVQSMNDARPFDNPAS